MSQIRSFVAIPLPDIIKKSVQDFVDPLRVHDSSIRWVKPEGIHITLKFLGDVEEDRFEKEFFKDFKQLSGSFKPITVLIQGVGQFPARGNPRLLWAGVEKGVQPLIDLAEAVDNFFEPFGFAKEKRKFSAHLTIGRVKEKPSSGFFKAWTQHRFPTFGEFLAEKVVFYRSELTKSGAVYSVLHEFNLNQ